MSQPLVWITGGDGLIGSHLVRLASTHAPGWRVLPLRHQDLELTQPESIVRAFQSHPPDAIIHTAALSRSAGCQQNPALARQVNVEGTARLLERSGNIPFIFLSTDLVFDGRQGGYKETDTVNPLSVYAETKVEAENLVRRNPRHTVVRLSLTAGRSPRGDRSFTEEMHQRWSRGETLRLFTDEFRSPLPAPVTAQALWELLRANSPGVFHMGGAERLSRWDIGQLLAARWPDLGARMEPSSAREFPGPPRPLDTSLDCTLLQARLSFPLPGLKQWLGAHPGEPI